MLPGKEGFGLGCEKKNFWRNYKKLLIMNTLSNKYCFLYFEVWKVFLYYCKYMNGWGDGCVIIECRGFRYNIGKKNSMFLISSFYMVIPRI